jgi:ferredoxin, 2Fe-2S
MEPTMALDTHPSLQTDIDETFLRFSVRLPDGTRHFPEAASGFRIMELIRAFGIGIKAECGGVGVCATCHVRISEAWMDLLPPPSQDEQDKLDEIPGADDRSRLACQLLMATELDGLELELAADSLSPQTYWTAG